MVESLGGWLEANWFNLAQTLGIVLGLFFTGLSLRRDARSRQLSSLLSLKQEHRELWNIIHERPKLARILKDDVDLKAAPLKDHEEVFLRQMIVHFAVAFELKKDGTPFDLTAFKRDVADIFSLPLPKYAFDRVRGSQAPDFVQFVETALKNSKSK